MIDLALTVIAGQLNQALRRAFAVSEDVVVLSNILEQDGNVATRVDNKIVVSLVNIERDTVPQAVPRLPGTSAARVPQSAAPIYLNLSVMFAANFGSNNYVEALKFISATIAFFQSRPVLERHNTPELDPRIDRLALDIANLSTTELSNLWTILSGHYLPSVLYRVRMVAIDLAQISGQLRPVVEQHLTAQP